MEATIVYWGNIGIMEKKMETTIVYSDRAQLHDSTNSVGNSAHSLGRSVLVQGF